MIQLNQIDRIFRTEEVETKALNKISFEIQQGDFVSIMGPSGCGKSTLLNIIGLLDKPSSGEFLFLNHLITALKGSEIDKIRKENIGFIFQNFNLIDELSVFDNIELPLIYNNIPRAERRIKVEEIAERLEVAHRLKHFPQQLSGGQQQRVAVARALVMEPKLILADEPTGNLDSKTGNEVMQLLTDLHANGSTIIMVTHSKYDASFSQKTITMKDGIILSQKENQRNIEVFMNPIAEEQN
jgi:putative ABC transport system ATP-binding protein